MFIIKNYDRSTMDYTAYESKTYRREYAGEQTAPGDVPYECYSIILDDGTVVPVTGTAYIENASGKTVDTVQAKRVEPPTGCMAVPVQIPSRTPKYTVGNPLGM